MYPQAGSVGFDQLTTEIYHVCLYGTKQMPIIIVLALATCECGRSLRAHLPKRARIFLRATRITSECMCLKKTNLDYYSGI
jgi:hypothetical protein